MDGEKSGPVGQECLFGWQHSPRKGMRGRPQHVWSEEYSNKIKLLLALGWSNERIANACGITAPTLRRHYFSEIKVRLLARDALEAERAALLWKQCQKGNVGALKEFAKLVEANDRMAAGAALRNDGRRHEAGKEEPEATKPVALGKKEGVRAQASMMILDDPDLAMGRKVN
jgi:hypothetical protein